MKTIQETVEDIISQTPFIEEALHDKLINVSSLAREIQPEVAKRLSKEVKTGAIMMAINRISPVHVLRIRKNIRSFSLDLKDFMVRSDLLDLTFKNSGSLQKQIAKIYEKIHTNRDSFFTVSQGIFETNMVLSANIENMVRSILIREDMIHSISELASITIKLPKSNLEQSGIYYFILKQFAWANISVQEIISTTHEITLIVKESDIQNSFQILMNFKTK